MVQPFKNYKMHFAPIIKCLSDLPLIRFVLIDAAIAKLLSFHANKKPSATMCLPPLPNFNPCFGMYVINNGWIYTYNGFNIIISELLIIFCVFKIIY